MYKHLQKIIFWLFATLLFSVPLILWPFTSEVFEFNKIVLVYILTTLIAGIWAARSITERKIIFRRTILDIPLLIFIGSQLISTLLSIDPLTSWLGYYSRFNGGLISTLCYSLLYWAFVSNLFKEDAIKLIKVLLSSAALVSVYGILEHFGIDKNIWVQDVASRVFSTLGQPNWLAAYVVTLLPSAMSYSITKQSQNLKFKILNMLPYVLSILFFTTLLFTKSRSGFLGFIVADIIFWAFVLFNNLRENLKTFLLFNFSFLILSLAIGNPFQVSSIQAQVSSSAPVLETGGTESGTIRKIVWKGALQIWQHYPIFGTGVETFAFSYYKERLPEHNLVSEWDFIYNKAHNEYLNFMANSGTVGILAYLILIAFSIYQMVRNSQFSILNSQSNPNLKINKFENSLVIIALIAGYVSILVTNFFGFSVVPTQLELFLFPAMAIALANSQLPATNKQPKKLENAQKIILLVVVSCMLYVVFGIAKYWYADTLFAKGKAYNSSGKTDRAVFFLTKAVKIAPNQALYRSELANSFTDQALASYQNKDSEASDKYVKLAVAESGNAISLSPANINLKRSAFGVFVRLSVIDSYYLISAQNILTEMAKEAPTDAKILYNLGLTYARTGQPDKAAEVLIKAIKLKSNYKEARLAYAILLINKGDRTEAKNQLEYILTRIDPNDSLTKQTLESIK